MAKKYERKYFILNKFLVFRFENNENNIFLRHHCLDTFAFLRFDIKSKVFVKYSGFGSFRRLSEPWFLKNEWTWEEI